MGNALLSQGVIISSVNKQSSLNFKLLWAISQSSNCSFCLQSETLQHLVSSSKSYLDEGRYTWRHNSVFIFLANSFFSLRHCTVYTDLPSFLSPFITGECFCPDLLLLNDTNILYTLELTVGFETNQRYNSDLKAAKYSSLITDLSLSVKSSLSIILWVLLSLWVLPAILFYSY